MKDGSTGINKIRLLGIELNQNHNGNLVSKEGKEQRYNDESKVVTPRKTSESNSINLFNKFDIKQFEDPATKAS